ncbi:MAG: hypothetical protein Q4A16_00210 [Lautropia sp.]|nr:hypothetical protein [Lautropia sp.]
MTSKPVSTEETLPRLSAIWWGIGARLSLAALLLVLVWLVIYWALH